MALTRGRKGLLGLLVSAVLLGLAEGVVRGVLGPPTPPMIAFEPDHEDLLRIEGDRVYRSLQGPVELEPFPVKKRAQPRVIWLGGSSVHEAFGSDDHEASGQLRRRLSVESLNLGAPAVETDDLVPLVPQLLELEPDALVIYVGHNDRGNRVFEHWSDQERRTMAVRGLLRYSKLFETLDSRFRRPSPPRSVEVDVEAVHERFEKNLSGIVDLARAKSVLVLLVTPASTAWAPSVRWACPETMRERLPVADPVHMKTPERVLQGLDLEGDCRDLEWARAVVDRDIETLDRLRDTDPLPMRADQRTVETVRRIAREHDALLVDLNAALREEGGGLEPHELFKDNLHFTPEGHSRVARLVAPVLREALDLGPDGSEP